MCSLAVFTPPGIPDIAAKVMLDAAHIRFIHTCIIGLLTLGLDDADVMLSSSSKSQIRISYR